MQKIKEVLKIALPAVAEMILYMMVWVVDTAFVGNYGGNIAVSSVSFSSEIIYTITNIFISVGISVGVTTMVAQMIGAGEKDKAEKYISQGLLIGGIVSGILAIVLGTFSREILLLAGAKGEVLYHGSRFMRMVSIGAFFNMICSILNSGLRGTGNTVTPLIVSVIINIVTISLDWILIYGRLGFKEMGIMGSAIATTAAYIIGFIFLVIYYKYFSDFKIKFKYLKGVSRDYMSKIIKLAIPSGMQEAAFNISRLVSLAFIMHIGTLAFAANTITTTIESISFMPGWGFAVAATALVGQRIGAKDYKNAREYAYISMFFGTGIMLLCSILFLTIPGLLIRIFIKEKETIILGSMCLMVASIEQPFMGISMILGGAMKGAGDTKTPFKISLISSWIIRIPLMYVVIFILKLNVVYVWVVTAIQWIFDGLMILYFFNRKSSLWNIIAEH
ncbi:MATE family efflux transporter [Caloramator sp. E03]|uniref:MATE family efflux transporter n=1 Tax=Caloramator sp. E03 TaxID=2576307 RepID=UPI0026A5BB95